MQHTSVVTAPETDLAQIKCLERIARQLEPTPAEWNELGTKVLDYAHSFIRAMPVGRPYAKGDEGGAGLLVSPVMESGITVDEALALLKENVDTVGINPGSGRMLGYIPGGALPTSAFGDFLAAIFNRYAGVFFSSPGAVRMENMMVRWMARIVGYPRTASGFLTSGGSLANMSAFVTAREAHNILAAEFHRVVVYLTDHAHHCIDKTLRIAGLKECVLRRVPLDDHYRMSAPALEQAIQDDLAHGLRPWLIVSSAGTTNTGAVDPLTDIDEIARAYNIWSHVDGAYGAFFALCPEGVPILRGMDLSDSLVLDPHKTLFMPYGTGALLVRDQDLLGRAHGGRGAYFQDIIGHPTEASPAYLSPELTRHFRGLRMWLPLKILGLAPFRAALSEKILLARYFHEKISTFEGFEVGPYPDLSVVTYRYVPPRGNANQFNLELTRRIQQNGRAFVTSTRLGDKVVLRLAVSAFRTHCDDIDATLEVLRELSASLADC